VLADSRLLLVSYPSISVKFARKQVKVWLMFSQMLFL